jgi:hypothetical protein
MHDTFKVKATVDHEEEREIEFKFSLPIDHRITSWTGPHVHSINGRGTALREVTIDPAQPNTLKVKYFVKGCGVVRVFGEVIDRKGRGWIDADFQVWGEVI